MSLQHEQRRVLDFVAAEKTRLLPQLSQLEKDRGGCTSFVAIARTFFHTLDSSLETRLETTVNTLLPVSADLASQRLHDLHAGLQASISFIGQVTASQADVPRELYSLVSWFFSRCKSMCPKVDYVVLIGADLATLEFRQLLSSLFVRPISPGKTRNTFPELVHAFESTPFFFIHVPPQMAPTSSSCDWPLILHECGHAVEEICNVTGTLFPTLPRNWEALQLRAQAGDPDAQEALWTQELVCDLLATNVGGPVFVWRFLRRYFALFGIFHPAATHPPVGIRMQRLIEVLRGRRFLSLADKASALLNDLLTDLDGTGALPIPVSMSKVDAAQTTYESQIRVFDLRSFEEHLEARCRASAESLLEELLDLRPVLVDPASLFTIIAFEERCEDPKIATLVADFIRLYAVEEEFHGRGLRG